eukprot:COSAG03_NODE_24916_length_269_cov_0.594118_1_plen_59_part_01
MVRVANVDPAHPSHSQAIGVCDATVEGLVQGREERASSGRHQGGAGIEGCAVAPLHSLD